MKVLVIDDEEDLRYIARLSLARIAGMTVVEAASGAEGVAVARAEQPDCILLDVMMPEMDGEATLAALQSDDSTKNIPVVFLTAIALTPEVKRMTSLGARGVIRKPFDPRTLAETLKELLRS
jgi:two-component system alkaline phosphatase synthesis response regulator PhoP